MLKEYLADLGFPAKKAELYLHILKVRRFWQKDYFKENFPLDICYPTYVKYLNELTAGSFIYKGSDERGKTAFAPLENTSVQNDLNQKKIKYQKCIDVLQAGDVRESLKLLGLDDGLLQIYQLLAFKKKGITKTAELVGKKRNSLYWDIDRLKQFGLASQYQKGKLKGVKFVIKSQLPDFIQRRLNEIQQTIDEFSRYIPNFADLQRYGQKPEVIYLEGEEEVEQVFEWMLNAKTEILNISTKEGTKKYLPNWQEKWRGKFCEKGTVARCLIFFDGLLGQERNNDWSIDRFLSERYAVDYDLWIFEDQIVFISFVINSGLKRLCATIIKNPSIVAGQTENFELLWQNAVKRIRRRES